MHVPDEAFLISCLNHIKGDGKPDLKKVAVECGMNPNTGAAYNRIKKIRDTNEKFLVGHGAPDDEGEDNQVTNTNGKPKKQSVSPSKTPMSPAKKRKLAVKEEPTDEDAEGDWI